MNSKKMQLKTGPNDKQRRLDRILRKALPDYPLSLIHRLVRQGRILVNGMTARPQDHIPAGALISIPPPNDTVNGKKNRTALSNKNNNHGVTRSYTEEHAKNSLKLRNSPFPSPDILWQDSHLLILNKPAGIAVHGHGSLDSMVQRYLACYLAQAENASLSFKPGPLHRLDKPTSGVIAFSVSLEGARNFSSLMRDGRVQKQYLALVEGCVDKAGIWDNQLIRDKSRKKTTVAYNDAEKNAVRALSSVTPLSILSAGRGYTLILAHIHTGRTHQIRAQAGARGHPLAGDRKYGGHAIPGADGFFLHAWKLIIDEKISVCAPLPPASRSVLQNLGGLNAEAESLEQLVLSANAHYN